MTRFQYLLVKHTGGAIAQGGQFMMIGILALIVVPHLPDFRPPAVQPATVAFVGALAIVVIGRMLEFWGASRTSDSVQCVLRSNRGDLPD